MRLAGMVVVLPLALGATGASSAEPSAAPGIFSNEELVYFEKEAGRAPPEWMSIRLRTDEGRPVIERIDAFGKSLPPSKLTIAETEAGAIKVRAPDGRLFGLRQARPATCWAAIPKDTKKPDGSTDWFFVRDLALHDQGGRAAAGGGDTGARPLILRMRNVVWAQGPNRPSLVLYVHTPDDPERAVSYSWADPEAKRIGINLRWMQASCTINEPQGGSKP